jgi:anti-sigma factor (TIGR02949 family)
VISCSDAVRQLWDYLDGAVGVTDREAIEEHLDLCQRCCGEAEFAEELRRFLADNASEGLPEETRTRLNSFMDRL